MKPRGKAIMMRKTFILCAAVVMSVAVPVSVPAADSWLVDAKTGCKVWDPAPKPNESISWSGSCKNGHASDDGILQVFLDGNPVDHYEGGFRDGKMSGHGVYTDAHGGRYDGEWRDGLPNGLGTVTLTDGRTFTGTWSKGCFRQGDTKFSMGTTSKACGF